ncbi:MAG TPA: alkaline phosphatase family protein, partial [Bacillota bacterium]|nr:alkaline phosphatase family protein [Bacillota bacterium]
MTIKSLLRPTLAATVIGVLAATAALGGAVAQADPPAPGGPGGPGPKGANPIQHVVVIFQENVSFDHYFATYPMAQNNPGEPQFQADPNTPTVNGLSGTLLTQNPNSAQPQRLGPSQALTCDQNHNYGAEQKAMDNGLMDKFVQNTGAEYKNNGVPCDPNQVMDYYDGNTVTALWNYAQNFAMSDNSFDTTFGPSTPGAVNLVSGQTHGAIVDTMAADGTISTASSQVISGKVAQGTDYSDVDPAYDDCTLTLDNNANKPVLAMTGQNVGDLLNARGVTWGWFEGGFRPTAMNGGTNANLAVCGASSKNVGGATVSDYIPHHEPFQYYASTANPHHLPPS